MRRYANLLSDADPASLSIDLIEIARRRVQRDAARDFDSYLAFLEETAVFFGFDCRRHGRSPEYTDRAFLL